MPDKGSKTWTLQPEQLFVMGDHRQESQDSRDFGPIEKTSVIGRAWIRYWPISQFGVIRRSSRSLPERFRGAIEGPMIGLRDLRADANSD